jgi:hypothetical protein
MTDHAEGDLSEFDRSESASTTVQPKLDRAGWMQHIDELCAEEGYFESLGKSHFAYFHDDGPILLVSFESLDRILARKGQMPFGHDVAKANGWSHLTVICDGETWFRDPAVWGYFDRLVDDAFFEDFDRVLFYGAGDGGYAACAYCVCAPGATVLAVSPRATLDPSVAGWDNRTSRKRRLDFSTRYGYAPDMTQGASRVFVVYDPQFPENAMHAALFRAPWVTALPARHFGDSVETAIENMSLLPSLLTAACENRLDSVQFARLWRTRRRFSPYLKGLLRKVELARRPRLALMICRSVVARVGGPRFKRKLSELEVQFGLPQSSPPDQTTEAELPSSSERD